MSLSAILISVATIWGVAVITPGPNFFITAQTAAKHSRLAGLYIVLGTCTGTILWAIAGYLGISFLFTLQPWVYATLKVVGGSYILYLGVKLLVKAQSTPAQDGFEWPSPKHFYINWRTGLLTNLANPKTAMFIASLFASTLPKDAPLFTAIAIIGVMVLISLLWYSLVVFVFSTRGAESVYRKQHQWVERFAGLTFIAFGINLVLSGERSN